MADFPAAISLPESAQALTGIAFGAAGSSENNFSSSVEIAGKRFQQGSLDSHSPLEFSDKWAKARKTVSKNRVFAIIWLIFCDS